MKNNTHAFVWQINLLAVHHNIKWLISKRGNEINVLVVFVIASTRFVTLTIAKHSSRSALASSPFLHPPLQLHRANPWPMPIEEDRAYSRREIYLSWGTSSALKNFSLHGIITYFSRRPFSVIRIPACSLSLLCSVEIATISACFSCVVRPVVKTGRIEIVQL